MTDPIDEKDRFIENIADPIGCLMNLIPTFESIALPISNRKQTDESPALAVFEVTEPAHVYVRKILDRFPDATIGLAERLGEANWQRHNATRKRMDGGFENREHNPKSKFTAKSTFHDSGLGTSVPAESAYAATTVSKTSFASSLAEREQGDLRVPPIPIEVADKMPFTCLICGRLVHNVKNRRDWK